MITRSHSQTIRAWLKYRKSYTIVNSPRSKAEAKTAKALALKAVETIEINSMDGITQAQAYRCNLWPSVSPSIIPALEAARRGERLVVSEETKKYVEQLKTLM
jgi:hypothetical protein